MAEATPETSVNGSHPMAEPSREASKLLNASQNMILNGSLPARPTLNLGGLTPWWRKWLRIHGDDPVPGAPPIKSRERRGRVVLHHPEPLKPTPIYGQRQERHVIFKFPQAIVVVARACGLD